MDASRRGFLVSAAATVLAGACRTEPGRGRVPDPDGSPTSDTGTPSAPTGSTGDTGTEIVDPWTWEPGPEPTEPWDPPGTVDRATFACGVQTGDATETGVLASCRQAVEPELKLLLARGIDDGWEPVLELAGLIPDDGVLQVELTNLIPDTTYAVVFATPDGKRRTPPARFRTALYPNARRVVRFGASSCLGSLGAPWPCLSRAAEQKLDAFLLLGDTIYADEGLRPAGDWEGHWTDALETQGLLDLALSTSLVATWDDHEVDNDWSWDDDGMPEMAYEALAAFRRGIPQRRGQTGSGIWRKLTWGDAVDLFVLDCRGERFDGDYVSRDQLDWLKAELSASTARFKLILNSVPITDMDSVYFGVGASDRWDGHPEQRAEILDHISAGVSGVLWISGDFHWGAVARVGRDKGEPGYDQVEVFSGPAGSPINPLAFLANGQQYDLVVTDHNYVLIEADPDAGTVHVAFVDGSGAILGERTLSV